MNPVLKLVLGLTSILSSLGIYIAITFILGPFVFKAVPYHNWMYYVLNLILIVAFYKYTKTISKVIN